MRWVLSCLAAITVVVGMSAAVLAGPFTLGNLVISRVGDQSGLSTLPSALYIDEYTTAGVAAGNTVALPTTAAGLNKSIVTAATSTSAAFLTRSVNGEYLTIGGTADLPVGTTTAGGVFGIERLPQSRGGVYQLGRHNRHDHDLCRGRLEPPEFGLVERRQFMGRQRYRCGDHGGASLLHQGANHSWNPSQHHDHQHPDCEYFQRSTLSQHQYGRDQQRGQYCRDWSSHNRHHADPAAHRCVSKRV